MSTGVKAHVLEGQTGEPPQVVRGEEGGEKRMMLVLWGYCMMRSKHSESMRIKGAARFGLSGAKRDHGWMGRWFDGCGGGRGGGRVYEWMLEEGQAFVERRGVRLCVVSV